MMTTSDYYFGKWLSSPPPGEEVVVTGISGRFPESKNVSELRDNLFNKKDMVTEDSRRWDLDDFEVPRRCGKIDDLEKFDAGYFGVHHRQADIMDPMTRKALETAIEAIMDAGLNPSELKGSKAGVFCAVGYAELEVESLKNIRSQSFGKTAYLKSMLPNRISFFLKLKGPSDLIDSACGSSLNALEAAIRAIRCGRCNNALVIGANVVLNPLIIQQVAQLGVLSPEGKCKSFDQDGKGFVRSDAFVCAFLQEAKNARRIYGKFIHIKINNDGFKKDGITVPSAQSQQQLITEVLQESETHPSKIGYVEAHGTGTLVGDPREVEAIDEAIAKKRQKPLLIGAIKSCIGHPESSSGLCSLVKAVIAMDTDLIAPNIHFTQVRKGLKGIEEGRIEVVTEVKKLDGDVIGINNLGIGGSNCHLILQRHDKTKIDNGLPEDDIPRLVCVSGRTQEAVLVMLNQINKTLDEEYVGLFHQIFKWNVAGHVYRGFAIVAKHGPIETSLEFYKQRPTKLCIFFGQFGKTVQSVKKYLQSFPYFRDTLQRIKNCLLNADRDVLKVIESNPEIRTVLEPFAVQIGIVELLKLLQLEATVVCSGSLNKLIVAYYNEDITLQEAVLSAYKLVAFKRSSRKDHIINFKNQFSQQSIILNVSDKPLRDNRNDMVLTNNFLEVLGRLYEHGHNPQIHKLYPDVQYPVSRNTPMISPFIQWNYSKNWYPYKFSSDQKFSTMQKLYDMSYMNNEDLKYMTGYVLDGINYIAPTELLNLVWKTFASSRHPIVMNQSVVFEHCTFLKSVEMTKTGSVLLLVTIQRVTGKFEVSENGSVLASGKIFLPNDLKEYQTDLTPLILNVKDKTQILRQEEIYRELNLRGYIYRGAFKGLLHCNIEGTSGYIQWENNWTTFMDNMLQMTLLQMDTDLLSVMTGIRRLTIDTVRHQECIKKEKNSKCAAYVYKECNIVRSEGIEICGITRKSVPKKKLYRKTVLEKHVFIPNIAELELIQSIRVNTQLIIENSKEKALKALEIFDDHANSNSKLILPIINDVLEDTPLITPDLTLSTRTDFDTIPAIKTKNLSLTSGSQFLLIIASKVFQRPTLEPILKSLNPKGFILTREEIDFVPKNVKHFKILTEHVTASEKLILFQKSEPQKLTVFIHVSWKNLDWLPELQVALEEESSVVVYSENKEPEGILGLVNCIRREPNGEKVRCFFIMDEAPEFDPELPFYQKQLEKQLALNVYQDKKWGTFRHLALDEIQDVESDCCFVSTFGTGDLSNLKWTEGSQCQKDQILVYPYFSALNFKNIFDGAPRDKIEQEIGKGFELSGRDLSGRRVMGVVNTAAIATVVAADSDFLCEVPDHWSLEEAATVVVSYATAIYSLLCITKLKAGLSVLIHSATDSVGLAAINVCLYHGCEIYATVDTEEKRNYLKKHFPQIQDSHMSNLETITQKKRGGRGVDVVLNFSGNNLGTSIHCMALGGTYIEIEEFDSTDRSLNAISKNINFHRVAVSDLSSEIKKCLINKINEGIKLGYVKPLPTRVFPRDALEEAFKCVTTGKSIGKVLIKIREEENQKVIPEKVIIRAYPRFNCCSEKSYIIIGGLGGFGLELAEWLILRGAKKLILTSRVGVQTGYQNRKICFWESKGTTVKVSVSNIAATEGCLELIEEANALGAVDAIFNLAVILKDSIFKYQTKENFRVCLEPKAQTASCLDIVTREQCPQLRYFVMFSSLSSGLGNAGQSNYGMGLSVMERICEKRKKDGLPGLAIQWGAIGDVGLLARLQKEEEVVIRGTVQQKISSCLDVLDRLLEQQSPVVSSMVMAEKNTENHNSDSATNAIAYILGMKDIRSVSPETTLADLGLDSMTSVEAVKILRKYQISVTTREVKSLTFSKLNELEEKMRNPTQIKF